MTNTNGIADKIVLPDRVALVTGGPLTVTDCGLDVALSLTMMVPPLAAGDVTIVGLNETLIVQVPDTSTVAQSLV